MKLTTQLLKAVHELGYPTLTPADPARRSGTVCVNPPDSERISRELLARDFIIDWRPGAGIRISPHFYSTEDECDEVIAEIAALAEGRPGLRVTKSR